MTPTSYWHIALRGLLLAGIIGVGGLVAHRLQAADTPATAHPPTVAKATYAGTDACLQCHDEISGELAKSAHGQAMLNQNKKTPGPLCEACHGPGAAHAGDPSAATAAPLKKAAADGSGCLSCHDLRLSANSWTRSAHHREGVNCLVCHGDTSHLQAMLPKRKPAKHDAKAATDKPAPFTHAAFTRAPGSAVCLTCHGEKRAELAMPSHHPVLEKRITCTDCHDPHSPTTTTMKRDLCVSCHGRQRGPFIYEHGAISGNTSDACLNCHRVHGSPNLKLLKLNNRGLCMQCHADRATHFTGRTCWGCHKAMHGSNANRLFFQE